MNTADTELTRMIRDAVPVYWSNPALTADPRNAEAVHAMEDAEERLRRFAPWIAARFPETQAGGGIIESPLTEIPAMGAALSAQWGIPVTGRVLLKRDDSLPVSGSVKARGGIYAVLKHTEELLSEAELLRRNEDYSKIAEDPARGFLAGKKLAVGSTGNLGLSIGIIGAALGYRTSVYISREARQWKKDLLRAKGVRVVESGEDYEAAVAQGRADSEADPDSFFIDDERSEDLFNGYSTAALRLKAQLTAANVSFDNEHPLCVYLPCGVGGGPGGITLGLKQIYGNAVRCYFVEPVQAPCMLLAMASGKGSAICCADLGLNGVTAADGLAVTRASELVFQRMKHVLDGCLSVKDEELFAYLRLLNSSEGIRIEPSACAGFRGIREIETHAVPHAAHLVWSTGGGMVPPSEMNAYLQA